MPRPLKASKKIAGVQSSLNGQGTAGAMNSAAAATLMVCRSALVKSPAASRAAVAKHRESIGPDLAKALEIVGSYTNEVAFTLPPSLPLPLCQPIHTATGLFFYLISPVLALFAFSCLCTAWAHAAPRGRDI